MIIDNALALQQAADTLKSCAAVLSQQVRVIITSQTLTGTAGITLTEADIQKALDLIAPKIATVEAALTALNTVHDSADAIVAPE